MVATRTVTVTVTVTAATARAAACLTGTESPRDLIVDARRLRVIRLDTFSRPRKVAPAGLCAE